MPELRKIQKIGDSLFIGIPRRIVDKMQIQKHEDLSIDYENGKMTVEPVRQSCEDNAQAEQPTNSVK